jgi:hypothetical protein
VRGYLKTVWGLGVLPRLKEKRQGWRVWVTPFPRFERERVNVARGRNYFFGICEMKSRLLRSR